MVHHCGFNPIYQVPFAKFCLGQMRDLPQKFPIRHYQLFPKFLTIFFAFFLKNFRPFKTHGIALQISINGYYHTESF